MSHVCESCLAAALASFTCATSRGRCRKCGADPPHRSPVAATHPTRNDLPADAPTSTRRIYDVGQLDKAVGAGGDPVFHEPPSCPFYQYPLGALSPYGDEVLPLLDSLVRSGGWDGKVGHGNL